MFGIRREQGRLAELAPLVRLLAGGGASWRPGLAALLAELGMDDEARAVLARVMADGLEPLRETLWVASLAYLADAAAAVGDEAMAAALYPELAPLEGQNLLIGHVVACHGAADRFLGMLAATLGDRDRAVTHFERALELNRLMGARTWLAHTAHQYGRALLGAPGGEGGERERAVALLDEAEGLAEALGMPVLRRRIAGVARSALPDGLAFRDAHVLVLLAAEASPHEIGDRVGVSEHEAVQLVRAVLERAGCSSRREAALLAARLGLVRA
jgi:DNA-binding CsgD family transcriptional regulator